MRVQYPNKLKSAKYIKALAWEYASKYPEFTQAQINQPIDIVVDSVSSEIDEFQSLDLKLAAINTLRRILQEGERMYELDLSQCALGVLNFYTRAEEVIQHYVSGGGKVEFPIADKERYMDFISEMTAKVVNDVCRETEYKICADSKKENRLNSYEEEDRFVEKVGKESADCSSLKKSKFSHHY